MKQKNIFADAGLRNSLVFLAGALVLLILALVFREKALWQTILSALSSLVSLFALREELLGAVKARDFRSGILMLVIAAIVCCCIGKAFFAALGLLLRQLGGLLLPRLRDGVLEMLNTRRQLNPLCEQLPPAEEGEKLVHSHEHLLNNYLTYLMMLLAALVAILSVLLGKVSVTEALSRAAVILALSGTAPLFAAFPLSDFASLLCAAESGVVFRGDSLPRLMELKLACIACPSPVLLGSAAVYPTRPEAVGAELMLRLAASACTDTGTVAAEKLAAISKTATSAQIERKLLPELGVVAKVKDIVVLAGSAEFMHRSGLRVLPFPENDQLLHMGVNGHYVGCIDFSESAQAADGEKAPENEGFFCFKDEKEAAEKRLPEEKLLHVFPASAGSAVPAEDISAVLGAEGSSGQIFVERCGRAGVAALMEQLHCARLGRKELLLLTGGIKVILLILAVFGLCPIWLAVLAELAVLAFAYRYTVHLLDYMARY